MTEKNLHSISIMSVEENNTAYEICPVCLDEIREKCSTSCRHIFCMKCILLVLSSDHGDICPICRTPFTFADVKVFQTNEPLLSDLKICGSVYRSHYNIEGLASYHFDSETDCYVSYAGPVRNEWPPLDNGETPPAKKPFTDFSIDENERIFRGKIVWTPTSWMGDAVWSVEMHFSENYDSISGTVSRFDTEETMNLIGTWAYGVELKYRRAFKYDIAKLLDALD